MSLMRIGSLFVLAIFFPVFAHAAALVNINIANSPLLETLTGIGPSKAVAIITYRTGNGPFARIEDIQNVSGIGPSTYAGIKAFITVGDTGTSNSATTTATSTTTTATGGGSPPEYIPIPTLRIVASGNRTVSAGADTAFTAVVYDGKGNKRDDATVTWSFGDGMRRTGASVFHAYYDPGEYIAVVHATTSDGGDVSNDIVMTVKDARIKIASVSSRGITLMNSDSRTLDLSLWRLSAGGQEFKIPVDTKILAGRSILFPSQVTGLSVTGSTLLLYPSGEVASTYPEIVTTTVQQPFTPQTSFNRVQEVEPIINTKANIQAYENAVLAPTAATKLAAVGAAMPPPLSADAETAPPTNTRTFELFRSPWTFGLLGVIVVAGAAFIFL